MKNLLFITLFHLLSGSQQLTTITTVKSGYSDETDTFQNGQIPQAGDTVEIRAGDTLRIRNDFYCKEIVFNQGTPKGVLELTNISFLHTGL